MYMADSCSSGVCIPVVASILDATLSDNYAHLVRLRTACCVETSAWTQNKKNRGMPVQAGGGLFYDATNAGSFMQLNASVVSNNTVDSFLTGSASYGLGGVVAALEDLQRPFF